MASQDSNAKGRLQTYKNQGKDVEVIQGHPIFCS